MRSPGNTLVCDSHSSFNTDTVVWEKEFWMHRMQAVGQSLDRTRPQEPEGLAGWVLARLRLLRGVHTAERREMRLVETLSLGGKRQLMLVECAGERYLVGGGLESVQTIVPASRQAAAQLMNRGEGCQ